MKDQITHPPDNTDRSVAKQKFKITNWPIYNKALINRGSLTFWLYMSVHGGRAHNSFYLVFR
ncbi:hypothetical protein DMS67_19645 [Klebsiella variicola]|nr:hypothetical protein [Klebsiella variicola]MXH38726.1 hypothetical protein [Klebsiella variicola]PXH44396.1 hypothetical protein DMS67_19645 [Klebsiella variicola]PXK34183.1 hypothetical protein DMR24_21465 [Klebsiella variicola]GKJ35492.1 hypothetical protein NUKP24_39940 [Klebsiella variicola]